MCSSQPPSCNLFPYSGSRKLVRPVEDVPDKLSLVLERAAVALYCYNSGEPCFFKPKHFTILDVDETDVNITSCCIDDDDHICLDDKGRGSDWGSGGRVNKEFSQFMETIVDDPGFKRYISVSDLQLQQKHKADLNELIYGEFEKWKCIFGDGEDDDQRNPTIINIPRSFMKFYRSANVEATINSRYRDVADLDECELIIEPQKMKEFFQPILDQICHDTDNTIARVKKLEAVYLIGKFGGCKLVKKAVQDKLRARDDPKLDIDVIVPVDHNKAVARGAIRFHQNPDIILDHTAEATFEDSVTTEFDTDAGALSTPQMKKLVSSPPSYQTFPTSTVGTLGELYLVYVH